MDPAKAHKDKYGETPMERLDRMMREQDESDKHIPFNLHLTEEAGSDPEIIAQIAQALLDGQPFGLKGESTVVVFIPAQFRAYTVGRNGGLMGRIDTENKIQFLNHIKLQYLIHKQFVDADELLGLIKLLQYAKLQKRLGGL